MAAGADEVEHAGESNEVDVVPGSSGQRPVLAPPGHSPVDQRRIGIQAFFGPHPETFGYPGPKTLNQSVRLVHHP